MKRVVLLLTALCILSIRCKKACIKNKINPAFIGFLKTDIDTFVLRSFKPNDNYLNLIDTMLVVNVDGLPSIFTTIGDTTFVYVNDSDPDRVLTSGFDWEIYVPAKNRIVRIANIIDQQTEGTGRVCYNPITSYLQDGRMVIPTLFNSGEFFTSGYRAYIHN